MTPAQLRILKTLPKVIEAVRAFQAESNELMGLLGQGAPPPNALSVVPPMRERQEAVFRDISHQHQPDAAEREARAAAEAELARRQTEATPEQKEAEDFLRSQEAPRKSLLNAALGIAP